MERLLETNEAQDMMTDTLARYLRERYPFEQRNTGAGAQLWRGLAQDLGVAGAALPEHCGGLGGGFADHALIMEQLGYALAGEPYLSTAVIGAGLLERSGADIAHACLRDIAAGNALLAFAYAEPAGLHDLAAISTRLRDDGEGYRLDGHKAVVRNAASASYILASAKTGEGAQDIGLVLLPPDMPGITRRDYLTLDGGQASELYFDRVPLPAQWVLMAGGALPAIEEALDLGAVAVCAEAVGVMRRLVEDTVAYSRERRQFGVAIASFQVLRHRMADMLMQLEQARAITGLTVARLAQPGANRSRLVSSAMVTTARACRFIGQAAVQIHGGMGMTDELAVGHYFKRATVIAGLFGPVDHHLRRYANA